MTTQTARAADAEKIGETGVDSPVEDDGEFAVDAIASAVSDRPPGAHGFGISYAGELPKIVLSQAIELTEFDNRPA
ncbi:MAG: hypothetical protein WD885_02680 [Candidatus Saccharimonadales bacterium]